MPFHSFVKFVRTQAEDAKPKSSGYKAVKNAIKRLPYNFFWVKNCFDHSADKNRTEIIAKLDEIQKVAADNYENHIQILQDKLIELKNLPINSNSIQIKINQFINNVTLRICEIRRSTQSETKSKETAAKTITLFVQNCISLQGMVEISTIDYSYLARIPEADFLSFEIQKFLPLSLSATATGNDRQCVYQLIPETLESLQETIAAIARGVKISLVQ